MTKENVVFYVVTSNNGYLCFANASWKNRLEPICKDLCNAFTNGVVTSNSSIIFTRKKVNNFRNKSWYGAIYLFKKMASLEEILDDINNIWTNQVPCLLIEKSPITIRTRMTLLISFPMISLTKLVANFGVSLYQTIFLNFFLLTLRFSPLLRTIWK